MKLIMIYDGRHDSDIMRDAAFIERLLSVYFPDIEIEIKDPSKEP